MLLYLIKFFVVLVDIQTLITIVAANMIKDPRHIYFWAIVAALVGEGIAAYLGHADFIIFCMRAIGQLLLGIYIVRARAKRGAFSKASRNTDAVGTINPNMGQSYEVR